MLAPHEIVPALESLREALLRPNSDIKTASYNASVTTALRKKIAKSIVANAHDDNLLRQIMYSLRFQIHNTALLSILGVDIAHMNKRHLRIFQTISEPQRLLKVLEKMTNEEDTSYLDLIFEGTELATADTDEKKKQTLAFLKLSEKSTEFVKLIFGIIKKARAQEGYAGADFIAGIPTSEYVADIITKALVGVEDAASDEQLLIDSIGTKKVSNNALYGKLLRKALRRKTAVAKLDPSQLGKTPYTWLKRRQTMLNDMSYLGSKVLDVVKKTIAQDRSAQIGSEEQFSTLMESVTQAYSDVVEDLSQREAVSDTEESRKSFKEARDAYENDPSNDDLAEEYAKIILTRIRTAKFPLKSVRWLLDNINHLSEEEALQEKARDVIYDVLFKRGALLDYELQYLDGIFDEKDLKKSVDEIFKLPNNLLQAGLREDFQSEESLEKGLDTLDGLYGSIGQLYRRLNSFGDELVLKNEIAVYVALRSFLQSKKDDIELFLNMVEQGVENFGDEDDRDFFEGLRQDTEGSLEKVSDTLLSKTVLMPKKETTSSGATLLRGTHPLNSYSISDYTGLDTATLDVGGMIASQSNTPYKLSALDARVATQVTRALEQDQSFVEGVAEVEAKKAEYDLLLEALADLSTEQDEDALRGAYRGLGDFLRSNRDLDKDLAEALDKLFDLERESPAKRKKAVDSVTKDHLDGVLSSLKERYKGLYTSRLDTAVKSVYGEVLRQSLSEKDRLGKEEYIYRIHQKRTLENLSRDSSWESKDLELRNLLRGKDGSSNINKVLKQLKEWLKGKGQANLIEVVAKEKGVEISKDRKGEYKVDEDKVTTNEIRSVLTAIGNLLRKETIESFKSKALAMTEEDISKKQRSALSKLGGLGGVDVSSLSTLSTLLRGGHIVKADQVIAEIKSQLGEGGDEAKKALDDLREASILRNAVTFEDRIRDRMDKDAEEQVKQITAEREKELKRLQAKKERTEEEEALLSEMLNGIDSFTKQINQNSGYILRQEKIKAVRRARNEMGATSRTRYAVKVEQKEGALLDSARKLVETAVGNFASSEVYDNPLADEDSQDVLMSTNKEFRKAKNLGLKQRARTLKKLSALRERFASETRNVFTNAVKRVTLEQVEKVAEMTKEKASLFPSFDSARDGGFCLAYLKLPYMTLTSMTDSNGKPYTHQTQNVFSDINYAVNIRGFARTVIASANVEMLFTSGHSDFEGATNDLNDFYENFFVSPAGAGVLAFIRSQLEITKEALAEEDVQKTLVGIALDRGITDVNVDMIKSSAQNDYNQIFKNTSQLPNLATANYKGLLSDMALIITLHELLENGTITEQEIASAGYVTEDVIEFAKIFGADKKDLLAGA